MRPRAARIPGIRDQSTSASSLLYSSKVSKWLDDEHLVRKGKETDWKKQYKLRYNWSRGSCDVRELRIAERPSLPPMLVRLHEDIVITADGSHGLRAWLMKGSQSLLATLALNEHAGDSSAPTSLAVDNSKDGSNILNVAVGFEDGRFGIYTLNRLEERFHRAYVHAPSSNGIISAIGFSSPYLVTMTEAQLLSLYAFPEKQPAVSGTKTTELPRLLSSLKSHTAWPPLSLSIRASSTTIITSVAYALPNYLSGWSIGLQELRLTLGGTIILSRLTSAANQGFTPLFQSTSGSSTPLSDSDSPPKKDAKGFESRSIPSLTRPTSLSYSHPYLLASHPDNTLTLYLVQSTEADLVIGNGIRLWGHTSSVSGAHVGDRGKAVSVSAHGDEIRVWELEGGINSGSSKRRAGMGEVSVQVRPERISMDQTTLEPIPSHGSYVAENWRHGLGKSSTTKGWVGFDEERVIVLKQTDLGSQALVVYDFS